MLENPIITFKEISIPVNKVKIYVDFLSLFKTNPIIKKININFKELDIVQLNKLSNIIKPSNLKSIVNNNIKEGKLISQIEIFLDKEGLLENFVAKGNVYDLNFMLLKGFNLSKASFSFFADKNDILIKKIFGNLQDIIINDGDMKLNLENGIKIDSNFNSKINLNEKKLKKYQNFFKKKNFTENIKSLKANFKNSFSFKLDKTYKIENFVYKISGKLEKSNLQIKPPFKNIFLKNEVREIFLSDFVTQMTFSPDNMIISGSGKYSFDNLNFLKIKLKNIFKNQSFYLTSDFEFKNDFAIDLINYKKTNKTIANISFDVEKKR